MSMLKDFLLRLLQLFGLELSPLRNFALDDELHASLQNLAALEQRPIQEVATDLLQHALDERQAAAIRLKLWRELSPRQQDIAALVCLGYTNQQIGERLYISTETVKTHVRNVQRKLGVHTKLELRQMLNGWDFSAWEYPPKG